MGENQMKTTLKLAKRGRGEEMDSYEGMLGEIFFFLS
jgi:hypothetical protein